MDSSAVPGTSGSLLGRTVVVTGASDGIGAAAVPMLQALGARVVIVGRSPEKTKKVADATGAESLLADYASLASVAELADALLERCPRIDVLANNAGFAADGRVESADGHEMTFQVNHLAPYLLTRLLQQRLVDSRATVIQTASIGNMMGNVRLDDLDAEKGYRSFSAYATSKLENILFTYELQRRWGDLGVTAASFHPGVVSSNFGRGSSLMMRMTYASPASRFFVTPAGGADTLVWLASTEPGIDWKPAGHYARRRSSPVSPTARKHGLAAGLWDRSEAMVSPFLR